MCILPFFAVIVSTLSKPELGPKLPGLGRRLQQAIFCFCRMAKYKKCAAVLTAALLAV